MALTIEQLRISATYIRRLAREHPDSEHILQRLGIVDVPRDDAGTVALTDFLHLLRTVDAHRRDRGWHLDFARRTADHFHGPLTFALMSAPSIGDGLEAFAQYVSIRGAYLRGKTAAVGLKYVLELQETVDLGEMRCILLEIAFRIIHDYLAIIGDVNLAAATLSLRYRHSAERRYYRDGFDCPVSFCQPRNALTIPIVWTAIPNPQYDEATWANAISQCNKALPESDPVDIITRTQVYIDATLAQRNSHLCIDDAARHLGISVRTLIRRLRGHGTSFQTLRDRARQQLAIRLLAKPSMTVEDVALAVGFSDAANFTRAFKRWHGAPPGQFRRSGGHERS